MGRHRATPTLSDRPTEIPAPGIAPTITRPRATYVFFFDQPHLTMAGRGLSLDTTADLIKRLVVEGSRASIVSSAKRLETIVPLTGERGTLLAGLERLRTDLRQWDSYSRDEEPGGSGTWDARSTLASAATMYAREEWMVVRKSTERLASVVSVLAESPRPERSSTSATASGEGAGLHFIHFAARGLRSRDRHLRRVDSRPPRPSSTRSRAKPSGAGSTSTRSRPRGCSRTDRVGTPSVIATLRTLS